MRLSHAQFNRNGGRQESYQREPCFEPPTFQRYEQVLEILGRLGSAKISGSRYIYPWQATTSPLHHSLELSAPRLGRPHPEQGEITRPLERAAATLIEVLGD